MLSELYALNIGCFSITCMLPKTSDEHVWSKSAPLTQTEIVAQSHQKGREAAAKQGGLDDTHNGGCCSPVICLVRPSVCLSVHTASCQARRRYRSGLPGAWKRGAAYGSEAAARFPVRWWKTGLYLWPKRMTPVWLIMGYYQWNLSRLKIRDSCPRSPTSPLPPNLTSSNYVQVYY